MNITDLVKKIFYKLFWIILGFTMTWAIYGIIKVQYNIYSKNFMIIAFIFYTVSAFILWYLIKECDKTKDIILVLAIVLIAVLVRLVMVLVIQTEPVSDFSASHEFYKYYLQRGPYIRDSSYDFYQLYYTRFPAWFPYMKIISGIYNVLGFNVKFIILLNICLNAFTMIIIYYAGKIAFSHKIALIAMIIYGFCPSLILYSGITTPDHFAMLLTSLVMLSWFKMEKYRDTQSTKKYKYIIFTCLFAALLNLFKPVSVLLLIVFFCVEFAVSIIPNLNEIKTVLKLNYKYWLFFIVTFLLFSTITTGVLNFSVEKFTKKDVVNPTSLYLYTGWGADEKGNYNQDKCNQVLESLMIKYGGDQQGMIEEVKLLAKQQFEDNKKYFFNILNDKFIEVMASEYSYYGFANTSSKEGHIDAINNSIGGMLLVFSIVYMAIIYLSILILSLTQIVSRKLNRNLLFLGVTIFGYLMITLIGAAQSRYKCIVMPFFVMLSACVLKYIQDIVITKDKNISKVNINN